MIQVLHLSPDGSDRWNGVEPEPNEDRTDGPLATFEAARLRVRQLRDHNLSNGTVTVKVQPGTYRLPSPLCFHHEDHDIVFIATGEGVIVKGSLQVDGLAEREVNGSRCWVAEVSPLLMGWPVPRSLFVNGERRARARFPKKSMLEIESVPDHEGKPTLFQGAAARFVVREGDFDPTWRHPSLIEAVVNHLWIEERMPVVDFDWERRLITSDRPSVFTLKNLGWMGDTPYAKYYWENVFEAMTEPGEWYLDSQEERLYYLPLPEETLRNTRLELARHCQLVRLHGEIDSSEKVHGIHFRGINFVQADWKPSDGWGRWWDPATDTSSWRKRDSFAHYNQQFAAEGLPRATKRAAVPQAAHDLPGAISLEAATHCSFAECTFRGLGFYAIDVRMGCSHLRFQGNRFQDIGAGAVKVDGATRKQDDRKRTHRIYVGDNHMHQLGRVFPSAVGVCLCHTDHNLVEHNEISDLYYSAISIGWVWGFDESPASHNIIQYNHLYNIGQGRLSDMGAIYTLGVQPGTLIKANHIHDVRGSHYGGWGLYLDEGSSLIRVEQNLIHHTNSQALHEHWGRGNIYCDNVFALAKSEAVILAREDANGFVQHPAKGADFYRNIFLVDGTAVFRDCMAYFCANLLKSDLNLLWDIKTEETPGYVNQAPWSGVKGASGIMSLTEARTRGWERHSKTIDPLFADPQAGDFTLRSNSPSQEAGIEILDTNLCGPRPTEARATRVDVSFRSTGDIIFAD